MKKLTPWLLVVGVLVILGVASIFVVRDIRAMTRPVRDFREEVGTQIAQVLHPTPTILPDPVTIVREVRALARLETIQYTVEKVITAETGQGPLAFLFGDRLLLVAHGTVIAGVDLGLVGPDQVWFDELGRVYMRLPEAEVFVASLDNEESYVYDRDTGILTHGDINLEAAARLAAEEEILRSALEDGILDQAKTNAENYLYRLLRSLGFEDILFVYSDEAPEPTPTPSPIPLATATPGS